MTEEKKRIADIIEDNKADFETMSDTIWDYAEILFEEYKSSKLQADYLAAHGFKITMPVAGLDTAFVAEWGEGKPIIGVLGEYDALPNCSQEADVPEYKPIVEGGNGHACGHNILGTACVEAFCALKTYMEETGLKGTIRYYGCPAEEGGGGKVIMMHDGLFDDLDAALSWHPAGMNDVSDGEMGTACVTANFNFHGIAAHAAGAPDKGRSALDAVELMNVGANFLREHVPDGTRIHYAILNSGGPAPNVVHAEATVQYVVRSHYDEVVADVFERIKDISKGAALMTGTKVDEPVITSAYASRIPCHVINDLTVANFKEVLPIDFTDEDRDYAKQFQPYGARPNDAEALRTDLHEPDRSGGPRRVGGSSDCADVSWAAPLNAFTVTSMINGAINHGWTTTVTGKSPIAHKGMHAAAKILAMTAYDMLSDEDKMAAVREDWKARKGDRKYKSLMFPED